MTVATLLVALSSAFSLLRVPCQPRAFTPTCCADEPPQSLRQRLRAVNVQPALLTEVSAVVGYRSSSSRGGRTNSWSESAAGLPLKNPFGLKPRFIASADRLASLPPEGPPEIAFIGRSNVGKSSLLNALTGVGSLAKVSDKPGKTRAINFFQLGKGDREFYLVDMPGCTHSLEHACMQQRTCDATAIQFNPHTRTHARTHACAHARAHASHVGWARTP